MRVSGNIYYTRKLREESFRAGYGAGKKTGCRGDLAQLFQRASVCSRTDRRENAEQDSGVSGAARSKEAGHVSALLLCVYIVDAIIAGRPAFPVHSTVQTGEVPDREIWYHNVMLLCLKIKQ